MGHFNFRTSDRYTYYTVDTSGSISGTWPNLKVNITGAFRVGVDYSGAWYCNGTTLRLGSAPQNINLSVNFPNGGSAAVGSVSTSLGWSGNNPSYTPSLATSINAPGCFSGSGKVSHSFTVGDVTNFDSSAPTLITDTSVTFTYNLYPNSNRYYYCKFKDMVSGEIFSPSSTITYGKNSSYTITGLTPNTYYDIAMVVYNRNGSIVKTAGDNYHTKFRTKSSLKAPFLDITNITSSSADVEWNFVENATSYDLEINGVIREVSNFTGKVTVSLEPETDYLFRVRARNGNDFSVWSHAFFVTTPRASLLAPTGLTVSGIEARKADLRWNHVSSATEYKIYLNDIYYETVSNTNTVLMLKPNQHYTVSVVALRGNETSPGASTSFWSGANPLCLMFKKSGSWYKGEVYIKKNNNWESDLKIMVKRNGVWEETMEIK